jgi:4-phospho-D-threonate 3-dehydrogenase / 4-phospho-D-erythronate 3-dehydrogenase
VQPLARTVLVGARAAVERAVASTGVALEVLPIEDLASAGAAPGTVQVLDPGGLDTPLPAVGHAHRPCGQAQVDWLVTADRLCRERRAQGLVMAPINTESIELAGAMGPVEALAEPQPFHTYLLVISGPLRVVHLIHHQPIRRVCDLMSPELVEHALVMVDRDFRAWGLGRPRIVVSGWNPHAYGEEEKNAIAPGVARARAQGVDATGPCSPDSVFRWNIEGKYDVVLCMAHDQGHIAIKTWGFVGNCSLTMGMPYVSASVAHGTAYDIAGTGMAKEDNILEALLLTASLAAGKGLPESMRAAA